MIAILSACLVGWIASDYLLPQMNAARYVGVQIPKAANLLPAFLAIVWALLGIWNKQEASVGNWKRWLYRTCVRWAAFAFIIILALWPVVRYIQRTTLFVPCNNLDITDIIRTETILDFRLAPFQRRTPPGFIVKRVAGAEAKAQLAVKILEKK